MELQETIAFAKGEKEADLLLKDAQLINVFSGKIESRDVAIAKGVVVGFGDYRAREVVHLKGRYLAPAFIDAHVHIESSMVGVREYARAILPHGVTTVVTDFHEIANVMGIEGITLMRKGIGATPLNLFVMLPSCVPATHLETAGAEIRADELHNLMHEEWVKGLGEMMNVPGVIHRAPEVMKKIQMVGSKRVDGHAPKLGGKDLTAYIIAGISSDHECTSRAEAEEKRAQGMYLMIRESSIAKNLEELTPLVTPQSARWCMFVSDDRHPSDLISEGSIDVCVRKALQMGVDPITAIQMATINPAEYFSLQGLGAIAPGYRADILVIEDLKNVEIQRVYKDGRLVAEKGRLLPGVIEREQFEGKNTFYLQGLSIQRFQISASDDWAKVIEVIPHQIVTKKGLYKIKKEEGLAVADTSRDILKIAVVERYKGTGNVGVGFVKGFGLKEGAIASSVAHDSHNIVVVGVTDDDMFQAVQGIAGMRGGLVAMSAGKVRASLPLPIAGLMSDLSIDEVRDRLDLLHRTVREMGGTLEDPFMTLSFMALPVIPELKITDRGLVDVTRFEIIPLFVNQ